MRAGRIRVSEELLLRWLQFPNAVIRAIEFDTSTSYKTIDIVLEDREMPEVAVGDVIPVVCPSYCSYEDGLGNRVAIRQPLQP